MSQPPHDPPDPSAPAPSSQVYAGRVVTLVLRQVPGPDGAPRTREIVEHAPGAAVVAVDGDGQVLLVRQHRPAVGSALLELPAGIVDPGEAPATTARRELEEETGFTPLGLEPLARFYPSPGFCTEDLHVFLARGLRPCLVEGDADEDLELVRLPVDEAIAMVERGEITDAKTVVGLLMYARRRQAAPAGPP